MKPESGVELIAAERERHVIEGWTPEHDDCHTLGEMAMAAICYAAPTKVYEKKDYADSISFEDPWPWESCWDKREYNGNEVVENYRISNKKRIRNLVKAGALIAAEIDRLRRAASRKAEPQPGAWD